MKQLVGLMDRFKYKAAFLILSLAQKIIPNTREASNVAMNLRKAIDSLKKLK